MPTGLGKSARELSIYFGVENNHTARPHGFYRAAASGAERSLMLRTAGIRKQRISIFYIFDSYVPPALVLSE